MSRSSSRRGSEPPASPASLGRRIGGAALAWLRLRGTNELHSLILEGAGVSDGGLAHLNGLPRLSVLFVGDNGVTDVGLAHLTRPRALETLGLSHTKVTDAGLAYLKRLPALKNLNFGDQGFAASVARPD